MVLRDLTDRKRMEDELRAIGDDWPQRVADYETFMSAALREHVRGLGIEVIGWRPLREAMPVVSGAASG